MGRKQDFSKSVIYHIRHIESKEVVYVGSTTNFSQRKSKHKYNWNKEGKRFTYPIYCHIRDNGGFNCFEVIPIQSLKLENKTELLIAEQVEIDKHQTLVNSCKAHRTVEETRIYNNEKSKKWRKEHKEERKQYEKQYREEHKEQRKEQGKQYNEEHKEDIKQYNQQYWEEHKENIKEKQKQPVKCPICNSTVTRHSLKRHQRTKKCQEYLNK